MPKETREKLIAAATQLLEERGYRGATIQEVARRSGANIAAVHYHFGDKATFFGEVLARRLEAETGRPPTLADAPQETPAERLAAFVLWFLQRITGPTPDAVLGGEHLHGLPDALLDKIVEAVVRPEFEALDGIVDALLEGRADEGQRRLFVHSVLGQCAFYRFGKPIMTRLHGDLPFDTERVQALAHHVTQISLAGLRAWSPHEQAESKS